MLESGQIVIPAECPADSYEPSKGLPMEPPGQQGGSRVPQMVANYGCLLFEGTPFGWFGRQPKRTTPILLLVREMKEYKLLVREMQEYKKAYANLLGESLVQKRLLAPLLRNPRKVLTKGALQNHSGGP